MYYHNFNTKIMYIYYTNVIIIDSSKDLIYEKYPLCFKLFCLLRELYIVIFSFKIVYHVNTPFKYSININKPSIVTTYYSIIYFIWLVVKCFFCYPI